VPDVETAPELETAMLGEPVDCTYDVVPWLPLVTSWSLKLDDAPVATVFAMGRFCEITFAIAVKLNDASMNEGAPAPQMLAEWMSLLGYGVELTSQRYTVYDVPETTVAGTVMVPPRTGGLNVLPL
jgi:hypothetical protein